MRPLTAARAPLPAGFFETLRLSDSPTAAETSAAQGLLLLSSQGSPPFLVESNPLQSLSPVAVWNSTDYRMLGNHGKMVASQLEYIRSMVLLENLLQQKRMSLITANLVLAGRLVESIASLEQEWLARVERLNRVVHLLWIKFHLFDQEMHLEHKEAMRIYKLCEVDGHMGLIYKGSGENYFPLALGAAEGTLNMYKCYSPRLGTYSFSMKRLQQTFRIFCQIAITKTIQEIEEKMPSSPQPIERDHEEEGGASALRSFPIHEDLAVFQMCEQKQMDILERLRSENREIEEENKRFSKRKLELKSWESRFLQIVKNSLNSSLLPLFRSDTQHLVDWCTVHVKDHSRLLSELPPWMRDTSRCAGTYKKEMELAQKISTVVSEIKALIQEIEKGAPIINKKEGSSES